MKKIAVLLEYLFETSNYKEYEQLFKIAHDQTPEEFLKDNFPQIYQDLFVDSGDNVMKYLGSINSFFKKFYGTKKLSKEETEKAYEEMKEDLNKESFQSFEQLSTYLKEKVKNKKNIFNSKDTFKQIMPKKGWFKKFDQYWKPSEEEAHKSLKEFINNRISKYGIDRDYPSINGSSKLSPYIRNGQIHVAAIYEKSSKDIKKNTSIRKYINELGWREFSHSLINYFPQMLKGNLRKEFDRFPWEKNSKNLKAWKQGMTGYPIVDAGMRELYETGWMHNRIRMVVGSFLVKHLRINWKEGEKYFRNCLLDFNEANNVAQWQWVAGCGADAAPYFRIFNPILQGEKFDKEGLYVKKWVPELSRVPSKFIHKPWEMELKYQEAIKTIIGKDYPKPIVIHEEARAAALNAFQSLKKN